MYIYMYIDIDINAYMYMYLYVRRDTKRTDAAPVFAFGASGGNISHLRRLRILGYFGQVGAGSAEFRSRRTLQ